jgi:hypothetical protein
MSHKTLPLLMIKLKPLWFIAGLVLSILFPVYSSVSLAADSLSPTVRGWKMAEVTADSALIHQTPNGVSFITGTVQKGDLIWIKSLSDESEWVLIRPSEGSISWILQSDISELRTGEGRVKSAKAIVRPGRMGARLPGPPGIEIQKGTTIWLLANEPLVLPQREGLISWRAIEPPNDEPRFIRRDQIKLVEKRKPEAENGFVNSEGPGSLASSAPKGPQKYGVESPQMRSEAGATPGQNPEEAIAQSKPRLDSDAKQKTEKPESPSIESLEILDAPKSESESEKAPRPIASLDATPDLILKTDPEEMPEFRSGPPEKPVEDELPKGRKVSPLELPEDSDQALEVLESRFRVIVAGPLVSWDFRSILTGCESLRTRQLTAPQTSRLNILRDQAERQDEIGRSSRQFWESMRRSRSHDPNKMKFDDLKQASNKPKFDISGLMLPSRRDVEGHLLYNLIGDSGTTIAYLKLPPAAPVEKWLGKKVGVRGRVRYNEDLRARLVAVQDVELLEPEED